MGEAARNQEIAGPDQGLRIELVQWKTADVRRQRRHERRRPASLFLFSLGHGAKALIYSAGMLATGLPILLFAGGWWALDRVYDAEWTLFAALGLSALATFFAASAAAFDRAIKQLRDDPMTYFLLTQARDGGARLSD